MQYSHEDFMYRCLQLAKLGAGNVAPNPMVGAVLVYQNRIIGEGYHKKYGEAHAEVNCIKSVNNADIYLIKDAVLYVSLEPCDHFGKTPPCTDLIIQNKIAKVVIGCQDSFTKVDGKGIQKLKENDVEVTVGVLENECRESNSRFFLFHSAKRPYVILKWTQTADNKIAANSDKQLLISNYLTNKLVHKWRFEEAGILVGMNTALKDNPVLTNRLWSGKSPVRLLVDLNLKTNINSKIFNSDVPTIVFTQNQELNNFPIINIMLSNADNAMRNEKIKVLLPDQNYLWLLNNTQDVVQQILNACYKLQLLSILIEGGAFTLQKFIDAGLYDELRVIINTTLFVEKGLNAPVFRELPLVSESNLLNDRIEIYKA